jgi:hypothetical protein
MKKRTITSQMIKLFMIVFAVVLAVVAIILAIGWWQGWQTEAEFQTAIQIAGITLLGVGLLGVKGSWDGTRNFEYQYSMSASDMSSWERVQQNLIDFSQAFAFLLVCFAAGAICLVIGWLM